MAEKVYTIPGLSDTRKKALHDEFLDAMEILISASERIETMETLAPLHVAISGVTLCFVTNPAALLDICNAIEKSLLLEVFGKKGR